MTPHDQPEHVKRIITESETFLIALDRLGLTIGHYSWIINFAKEHKLQTKPLSFLRNFEQVKIHPAGEAFRWVNGREIPT